LGKLGYKGTVPVQGGTPREPDDDDD
jgi:hypothetical protein